MPCRYDLQLSKKLLGLHYPWCVDSNCAKEKQPSLRAAACLEIPAWTPALPPAIPTQLRLLLPGTAKTPPPGRSAHWAADIASPPVPWPRCALRPTWPGSFRRSRRYFSAWRRLRGPDSEQLSWASPTPAAPQSCARLQNGTGWRWSCSILRRVLSWIFKLFFEDFAFSLSASSDVLFLFPRLA